MRGKPRILVAGSLVMDLIAVTDRAPGSGETVVGHSFRTAPGGKGANQAVQCARLGAEVSLIGQVGGDPFGRELIAAAAKAGVDVEHVGTDEGISSGVGHVLLENRGTGTQNRITVVPGANFTMRPEQAAWLKEAIGRFDMVMLQLEISPEVNLTVAQYAREAGVPVMLNPAPAPKCAIPTELLSCVTFLSPNEQEAAAIAGLPLRREAAGIREDDLRPIAAALEKKGVEHVIITLGADGSAAIGPEGMFRTPAVRMPAVRDPTAAGDSFVASFCTGLSAGLAMKDALAFAGHAAALTVTRMGAMPSLPTLAEVRELLRQRGYAGFDPALLDVLC